MKVVILGWDALDKERIHDYDLHGEFGLQETKLDTYINPHIGEPHTKELWPSMITGLHPDKHGVKAATEGNGVNWDSTILRKASSLAQGIIPQDTLSYIGAKLRRRGVGLEVTQSDYYTQNGISTVFDDVGTPISIPNYQTKRDRTHGFDAHRDELWKELQVDWTVNTGMQPEVDRETVYHLLGREVGKRMGQTIQAMQSGSPLVWTWFGVLDSVGHMEPALGEDIVKDWYQVAASVTQTVKDVADEDTIVISVSDHGLQDGTHTHYATLCSDSPAPAKQIDHVFDVAEYLESIDYTETNHGESITPEDMSEVEEELEHLGYV